MKKTEFDNFADEYLATLSASIAIAGDGPEYYAEYKIKDMRREMQGIDPANLRLLDFGAGVGSSIPHIGKHFAGANLACLDVSSRSLDVASERFPGAATYHIFDGKTIPFPDASFDCVFAACVFHHIDKSLHVGLISEIKRVLKAEGLLFIFEHNPRNPITRRIVRECPFDENAVLIDAEDLVSILKDV